MTTPTREEIERLAAVLREPLYRRSSRTPRNELEAADALSAILADRDRLERERDEAEREIAKLVAFFRSPEGYGRFGWEGDVEGLSPAETAIKAMRGYATALARIAELERDRKALTAP